MNAVTSVLSDLQKRPETRLRGGVLTLLGMKAGVSGDIDGSAVSSRDSTDVL